MTAVVELSRTRHSNLLRALYVYLRLVSCSPTLSVAGVYLFFNLLSPIIFIISKRKPPGHNVKTLLASDLSARMLGWIRCVQVIFELVEAADTKSAAVSQAWSHWFSGKAASYEKELMTAVLAVTTEQALAALRTHLVP